MKKQQLIIGHLPTVDGKSAERVANISSAVTRSMRSCHLLARVIIMLRISLRACISIEGGWMNHLQSNI
jgi:hypothetical protein